MSMALHFFPRDRQFWLYHGMASLFTMLITLLTVLLWSGNRGMDVAATLLWILPYTVAVLAFRWWYRRRHWKRWPMARLIPLILGVGMLSGVFIMVCLAATVLPFNWDLVKPGQGARFVGRYIVSGALQAQVFVCAWCFIYVSYTGQRATRAAELANLGLQASLKEAQLSSLSNQLNPHFLFNALNNIRFMMHEDVAQADRTLVALSDILRYSLESSRCDKVSLAQEVEVIERYLAIARAQLEQRLQCSLQVPPALHACLVPPMCLQLLIENAVKHGIDQLPAGGQIVLSASAHAGQLHLNVTNDAPAEKAARHDGTGIGLENIARRLQLLYGEKGALHVRRSGATFAVDLTLPLEYRS
jgi:sensor histidine kinase YesM